MARFPTWALILGGVAIAAALSSGGVVAVNYITAAWMSSQNAQKWAPALAAAELAYGLPQGLLARMAFQESSFDQDVIDGTRPSSAGALGILQMLPKYFLTVRRPIPFSDSDTQDQIQEAAQQMAKLYGQLEPLASATGQNLWALALAGYNAGAEAVENAGGIPPYPQTQNYVSKILADVPAAAAAG
jgi:hypothetical protein